MEYKIKFVPYTPGSKNRCPGCGRAKALTLYMNAETGEIFPEDYGLCDRIEKCGYHKRPGHNMVVSNLKVSLPEPERPIDYLSMDEVLKRHLNPAYNHFFLFLQRLIGDEALKELKSKYKLGTSLDHSGFVCFPQIDLDGRVCQIKEMQYNPVTGGRVKNRVSQRWTFEKSKFPELNLKQCFFGLHLLRGNIKPVALVESEKTALICSHFMSGSIWLSTGSLGMLTNERCRPLAGRHLTFYPDLGPAFLQWKRKAKYLKGMASLTVNDYLEKNSEQLKLKEGNDLCDALINELNKIKK